MPRFCCLLQSRWPTELTQPALMVCGSVCHLNDITHHGVDFVVPAPAAEDAVVADSSLHVVHLHILPQSRAKVLRGEGLAEAANIVPLAFDGQQSGTPYGARIDQAAMHLELAEGQSVVLENQLHRFEIEFGWQVHDREIFLIECLDKLEF